MLRNTFIHLPGVGAHRERTLWKQGILDWNHFLQAAEGGMLRQGIYTSALPLVQQSLDAVAAGDAGFFHGRLPSRETWGGRFVALRCAALHKTAPPRLWFLEGNSNCRSRERIIVAEEP